MDDVFKEVVLSWKGKDYRIPASGPDGVLRCIARVEDVMTLGDIARAQNSARLPLAKLAIAFGIALRHAGCVVSDEEVYDGMFSDEGDEGLALKQKSLTAIYTLQAMMIPPKHLQAKKEDDQKKVEGNGTTPPPAAPLPPVTS